LAYRPQAQRSAWLAWAGLALVLAIPIGWGIHASFPWDVDNIAPGSVLKAMARHFGSGWYSAYGPVPYQVTAAVYAPLLVLMRLARELGAPAAVYPWGFRHPDTAIALLVVAARFVNLALALGIAALAARDAAPDGAERGRAPGPGSTPRPWLVALLLAGSATFVYYARTSNVDVGAIFWAALALALAQSRRPTLGRCAAAAAAAALAVCSKEQIAPFAAVAGGAALVRAWRLPAPSADRGAGAAYAADAGAPAPAATSGAPPPARTRGWRAAAVVAAAGLITYTVAWMLPFNAAGWAAHHRYLFETARYPRSFAATPAGYGALGLRVLHQVPLALGLPVLLGLAAALVVRPSLRGLGLRALAATLYLIAFIATVGYVYPRFLLPLLLLALPVAARGLSAALDRASPRPRAVLTGALVLLALPGGPVLDLVMLRDTRYAAEAWLARTPTAGALVEVAGNPHFQARVPPSLRVLITTPDSLAARPRGPRGDVVLLSSSDEAAFDRAPLRGAYLDSLGPAGGYGRALVLHPPALAGWVEGLPVAPTVTIYERAPGAGR
jgi:hypothetical protein